MPKIVKITYFATVGALLTIAPVFADNTATNENTGNNSKNNSTATSLTNCRVDQTNGLKIRNEIASISNTGSNQANGNIGGGSVDTGNASGNVTVVNHGNSNDATINCFEAENNDAINTNTGNASTNNATAISTLRKLAEQENKARATNSILRKAKTGKNKANGNIGDGKVETGTASGDVGVTNGPLNTNNAAPPAGP